MSSTEKKAEKKEYIIITFTNHVDDQRGINTIFGSIENDAIDILETVKACRDNNDEDDKEWKKFVFKKYNTEWEEDGKFDLLYDYFSCEYPPYEIVDFLFQRKRRSDVLNTDNETHLLIYYEKVNGKTFYRDCIFQ